MAETITLAEALDRANAGQLARKPKAAPYAASLHTFGPRMQALTSNHEGTKMAEASHSVHQAQVRATMGAAVMTLAKRQAIKATKAELQAQGLRPSHIPHSQIVARAKLYLEDHREELLAEAKVTVEKWREAGFFGKRCANLSSPAQGGKA